MTRKLSVPSWLVGLVASTAAVAAFNLRCSGCLHRWAVSRSSLSRHSRLAWWQREWRRRNSLGGTPASLRSTSSSSPPSTSLFCRRSVDRSRPARAADQACTRRHSAEAVPARIRHYADVTGALLRTDVASTEPLERAIDGFVQPGWRTMNKFWFCRSSESWKLEQAGDWHQTDSAGPGLLSGPVTGAPDGKLRLGAPTLCCGTWRSRRAPSGGARSSR